MILNEKNFYAECKNDRNTLKNGEKNASNALKQFYAKVAGGMAMNLPNFEQIVKENGVTDRQWDWFMRSL